MSPFMSPFMVNEKVTEKVTTGSHPTGSLFNPRSGKISTTNFKKY
jgi:hypothetical protein